MCLQSLPNAMMGLMVPNLSISPALRCDRLKGAASSRGSNPAAAKDEIFVAMGTSAATHLASRVKLHMKQKPTV